MTKFERVLSDDDFELIIKKGAATKNGINHIEICRLVEQATIAALKEQQEEQHKKDKFFFDVVDSIMFKSLLAMQCALIEAHQNGDAKKALENWVETMIDQFGDDFSEHYTDVTVSADEYHKQQMGKRNDGELIDATGLREKEFARHGYAVIPLYAHPCVSQNGRCEKRESQIPDGTLINEGTKGQHRSIENCLGWSDPRPPKEGVCYYDHVTADTPIGKFSIEWKSWKECDTYCVYLSEDYLDSKDTLEEAKAFAQTYVENLALKLAGYISSGNRFCVPDGWQLVPKEPTEDMYLGFCHVKNDIEPDEFREACRAMLAAAPKYDGGRHD